MPPCPNIHRFKHTWTFGSKHKSTGYMAVVFRGKKYKVHRLIAGAFLGDPPFSGATVDHINRDKTDNRLENLRYASHKMQSDNQQRVDDSLAKYGVRKCEDYNAYQRALYANNPEYAERQRAKERERYAGDAERIKTRIREYAARQHALGKRRRRCPDGSRQWMTDEEFNERYKKSSLMAGNSV